jgi:APA family basic amino acid/polyamine antiporter
VFRRGLGQPALFAIIYTSVASAIYFSLGVVAQRALGLSISSPASSSCWRA